MMKPRCIQFIRRMIRTADSTAEKILRQAAPSLSQLRRTRRRRLRGEHFRGFTIIELLVAMSIAVLMGFLINLIFIEATNAVSRGIATSKVINNSRTLGDQLKADFQIDHQYKPAIALGDGGVLVITNRRLLDVPMIDDQRGGVIQTQIRSDQVSFIYDNRAPNRVLEPICPGDSASFSNSTSAPFARIWYGHVHKTRKDGTDQPTIDLGTNDENRFANQWMLGRQSLFLHESFSDRSLVYVNGLLPTDQVVGYVAADMLFSAPWYNYQGLSDLAYFSYKTSTSDAGIANGFIVGPSGSGALLPDDDLNDDTYSGRALTNLTYADGYLRGNPQADGSTFFSSQLAQMHPCFMENVSDFIVEFAADTDNVNGVDRNSVTGNIIWYSIDNPPTWSGYTYNPTASPAVISTFSNADAAWIFRHHYADNWPYMLRFRCRLHDARGSLTDNNDNNVTNGIDDDGYNTDDDNDSLIDEADEVDEEDEITLPGLWFEFIVKVNRS